MAYYTTKSTLPPSYMPRLYKLPAVKECLYHPSLPTFRRMDIDTAAHKLPDEHCRTTSLYESEHFKNATVSLYKPPRRPLACATVTETGKNQLDYKVSCPQSSIQKQHEKSDENDRLSHSGYSMRYLSPAVTGSWKYSLRQEPYIDKQGQRPIPANIFSRHRPQVRSSHGITAGAVAWKP
eukprot:TCONS_00002098-protein